MLTTFVFLLGLALGAYVAYMVIFWAFDEIIDFLFGFDDIDKMNKTIHDTTCEENE